MKRRRGFTLVELSLAVVFVSILSITIALMITDAVKSYRRGMVLNQVNTVGMELVDDMRAAIQNAPSQAVANECASIYNKDKNLADSCASDGAASLVAFTKKATVILNGETLNDVPISGAVCFGDYTYMWNSGYFFSDEVTGLQEDRQVSLTYTLKDETSPSRESGFRLLKVKDEIREVCREAAGWPGSYNKGDYSGKSEFTLSEALSERPVDVLPRENRDNDQNNNLALYELTTATPAEGTAGDVMFYSVSFILGTVQGGMNVKATGNFCAPPEEYDSAFDYCAINKFNFAAQAAGE